MVRCCLAEGIGTFCLVFAGTGAIVVNTLSGGALTHLGICFVFGAVVAALIYALGPVSGAHFNPAVSIALAWLGKFPVAYLMPYAVSQAVGAVLASYAVLVCFGPVGHLGATLPRLGNWPQSFGLELFLTFFLMLVICGVARAVPGTAGLAVGLTVGLEATFGGPISGASMNPVRSLGPALVSGTWEAHWVYWVAPILGAWLAAVIWKYGLEEKE